MVEDAVADGQILDHLDAMCPQMLSRADSRAQEDRRGMEGSGRQDHLRRTEILPLAAHVGADADGPSAVQ